MTPKDPPDDKQLVAAAVDGDLDAFERLVRAHSDAVYAHALRFFGDSQSADDALQEVWIKVYRSLGSYGGTAAFATWLYRVTRNVCLDMFRRGKRRPLPVDPLDAPPCTAPDHANGVVDTVVVEQAMCTLLPEDREALGAVTLFGLSYAEASEELGVPIGTIKSRVFRARRTLLQALGLTGGERP